MQAIKPTDRDLMKYLRTVALTSLAVLWTRRAALIKAFTDAETIELGLVRL